MKEINIGKIIVAKRREKGLTQEDLAAYIGVSKASVSKWETGQSYPDITLLPQLGAYFNISIDDLMGYSPQLTATDIKNLYHRLADNFAAKPVAEVLAECQAIIKKYYSCFPLLLQMAVLFANHHMLAADAAPITTASVHYDLPTIICWRQTRRVPRRCWKMLLICASGLEPKVTT